MASARSNHGNQSPSAEVASGSPSRCSSISSDVSESFSESTESDKSCSSSSSVSSSTSTFTDSYGSDAVLDSSEEQADNCSCAAVDTSSQGDSTDDNADDSGDDSSDETTSSVGAGVSDEVASTSSEIYIDNEDDAELVESRQMKMENPEDGKAENSRNKISDLNNENDCESLNDRYEDQMDRINGDESKSSVDQEVCESSENKCERPRENARIEDGILNQISKVIVSDIFDTNISSDDEGSDSENSAKENLNSANDGNTNVDKECKQQKDEIETSVIKEDFEEQISPCVVDDCAPTGNVVDIELTQKIQSDQLDRQLDNSQDKLDVDKPVVNTQESEQPNCTVKELSKSEQHGVESIVAPANNDTPDNFTEDEDRIIANTLLPDRSRNPSRDKEDTPTARLSGDTTMDCYNEEGVSNRKPVSTMDDGVDNGRDDVEGDPVDLLSDDEMETPEFRSQANTSSCRRMQVPPPSPEPGNDHVFSCADLQSEEEEEEEDVEQGGDIGVKGHDSSENSSPDRDTTNHPSYRPLRQLLKTAPRLERPPPHRYLSAQSLADVGRAQGVQGATRMTAQQCKRQRRREECAELMRRQRRLRDNLSQLKHCIGAADRSLAESLRHSVKYRDACKSEREDYDDRGETSRKADLTCDEASVNTLDDVIDNEGGGVDTATRRTAYSANHNYLTSRYASPRYGLVDVGHSTVRHFGCGLGKTGSIQTRYVVNRSYY